MFCPKCGKINPDDAQMCSGCEAALQEEHAVKTPKKKKNTIKFFLVGLALLIIVCVIVFLLSGCAGTELPPEKMTF